MLMEKIHSEKASNQFNVFSLGFLNLQKKSIKAVGRVEVFIFIDTMCSVCLASCDDF